MEIKLIEKENENKKERTKSMPTLNDISSEEKINIDQIRATQIMNQPGDENSENLLLEKLPEDTKNYDKSIKIILLGDSNVGKTSIIHCFNTDPYKKYQKKSLGLENYNYVIKIKNIIIRMQIWDTVGQEKFDALTINYYKNADVAIFVYAINDINSFNKIEQWDNQLEDKNNFNDNNSDNTNNDNTNNDNTNNDNTKNDNNNDQQNENNNLIKVLLGNKKDLENERKVTYEQGKKFAEDKKFGMFKEISCNSEINEKGENNNIDEIIDLFDNIGKKVYKDFIKNDRGRLNSDSYFYQATTSLLGSENSSNKDKKDKKNCCC